MRVLAVMYGVSSVAHVTVSSLKFTSILRREHRGAREGRERPYHSRRISRGATQNQVSCVPS